MTERRTSILKNVFIYIRCNNSKLPHYLYWYYCWFN